MTVQNNTIEMMDLSNVPCPQNTSKILIKLELMDAGERIEFVIREGEAHQNVISSISNEAIKILSDTPFSENRRCLRIEKL